jgi:excisionase family DNA binding protein
MAKTTMAIDPDLARGPHFLEVAHVAHRLRVSQEYVRELLRKKKLRAVHLGRRWRVEDADLQAFIEALRHGAGAG